MTTNPPSRGKLHTEEALEIHLVEQLVTRQGWRERPANGYDPALALDPEMLVEFIRTTQPEVWEKLFARYKDHAAATLVQQTEKALRAVGTLEVLRSGIKIVPGIKISMCFFKPSANLNEPAVRRYESNILTVTRQVRYSAKNGNSIDVVLFVNGLPIATLELKNTMTGSNYQTAEKQYRSDRKPAR